MAGNVDQFSFIEQKYEGDAFQFGREQEGKAHHESVQLADYRWTYDEHNGAGNWLRLADHGSAQLVAELLLVSDTNESSVGGDKGTMFG